MLTLLPFEFSSQTKRIHLQINSPQEDSSPSGDVMDQYGRHSDGLVRPNLPHVGWSNRCAQQKALPTLAKCACSILQQRNNSNQMSTMRQPYQDEEQSPQVLYLGLVNSHSAAMSTPLSIYAAYLHYTRCTRLTTPIPDQYNISTLSSHRRNLADLPIFLFHSINTGHLLLRLHMRMNSGKEDLKRLWI
jgi:hypothetical protein